jgi:hypothetical protein
MGVGVQQSQGFRCDAQESRARGVEIAAIPYKRNADSKATFARSRRIGMTSAGLAA